MAVTVVLRDEGKQPVVFAKANRVHVHSDGHLSVQRGGDNSPLGEFAPGTWSRAIRDEEATGGDAVPAAPRVPSRVR